MTVLLDAGWTLTLGFNSLDVQYCDSQPPGLYVGYDLLPVQVSGGQDWTKKTNFLSVLLAL